MNSGLVWIKPPSTLVKPLQEYQHKLLVAVYDVAAYVGLEMQNDARRGARWVDRTGNARSGIFFAVDGFGLAPIVGDLAAINIGKKGQVLKYGRKGASTRGVSIDSASETDRAVISGTSDRLVLAFSHSMVYGRYLEMSKGGRYAIIMSTIERKLPQLERMLQAIFVG